MKHLFKYLFLFSGIVVMTISCEKENLNEQDLNTGNDHGGNTLFRKGKLSDYSRVKDFVTDIKDAKPTGDIDTQDRTSLEAQNDFIILEHQDIAIHDGDEFNTYTIPIVKYQQPQGTFSNLIVKFSMASDSTNAYILTYEPNPGYLEAYALDDRTAFSGQVSYEPVDYDGSLDDLDTRRVLCETVTITYCQNGLTGGTGPTHHAGANCTVSANMWTEDYTICNATDDGGAGNNTIDPPEGPNGGGPNNNTNSPNTGTSTSTIPANLVSEIVNI